RRYTIRQLEPATSVRKQTLPGLREIRWLARDRSRPEPDQISQAFPGTTRSGAALRVRRVAGLQESRAASMRALRLIRLALLSSWPLPLHATEPRESANARFRWRTRKL